jgi:hypothetical protein
MFGWIVTGQEGEQQQLFLEKSLLMVLYKNPEGGEDPKPNLSLSTSLSPSLAE